MVMWACREWQLILLIWCLLISFHCVVRQFEPLLCRFLLTKHHNMSTLFPNTENSQVVQIPWWRHQMETVSALLAICAGNPPVNGEFPAQRQVTGSFDDFFDPRLNKHLSKQWRGWLFETPTRPSWRHSNALPTKTDRYHAFWKHSDAWKQGHHVTMTSHESHIVSNHRLFDSLFNSLCGLASKKYQSPRYWRFTRGIH